jgi:hypothetical protein
METRKHPRGGVSPNTAGQPLAGNQLVPEIHAAAATGAAHPGFTYHGGPVIKSPQIISSFWGPQWSDAAHQTRANRLNQFLKDLLASRYMNIMTQYGVGNGAGAAGAFVKATFFAHVPNPLTEANIHTTIQAGIDAGTFPEPAADTAIVIYLGEGIGVEDPAAGLVLCEATSDTAFGFHSFFTTTKGNPCAYAIIPALENACLTHSCATDAGCSLHLAHTQEQRQTQVTSHEVAEMITDPQLNAWFEHGGGENGDLCNGQSGTITVGPNTWTVQKMYSKVDDQNSHGASFCVVAPKKPLPKLTPGP